MSFEKFKYTEDQVQDIVFGEDAQEQIAKLKKEISHHKGEISLLTGLKNAKDGSSANDEDDKKTADLLKKKIDEKEKKIKELESK